MVNRPAIEGGDELIVPLNVTQGGLASPRDTTENSYAANSGYTNVKRPEEAGLKGVTAMSLDMPLQASGPDLYEAFNRIEIDIDEWALEKFNRALQKFFDRQERAVLSKLGASEKAGEPSWYDIARWDRELSEDLFDVAYELVSRYGYTVMKELADDPSAWSAPRTRSYVQAVAEARAHAINQSTLRELLAALGGELPEEDEKSTPRGVFEYSKTFRASVLATMLTTSLSSWTAGEAVRQSGRRDIMKQWVVTSGNPRDTHAVMNGETVPFDQRFSNGAEWPGDTGALDVGEVAGCQCRVDLLVP
jgi:hypothetical protein